MSSEKDLEELMDSVKDASIRSDLVLTLIKKAYALGFDSGFNDGCEAVRHEEHVWEQI
jgi:hypothetical protein